MNFVSDDRKSIWRHLLDADLTTLEKIGSFIFLVSSVALTLYATTFGTFLLFGGEVTNMFGVMEAAHQLVKVAIIGLVVGFTTRAKHWSVLVFGLFLVSTLVLPTRDVARIVTLWTGQDSEFDRLFDHAEPGISMIGRDRDLANQIIDELQSGQYTVSELDPERRKEAAILIVNLVKRERVATIVDGLRANGTLTALRILGDDDEREVGLLRHSHNDDFLAEARFLRSVGLVRYPYDELNSVVPTKLGMDVIKYDEESTSANDRSPAGILGGCANDLSSLQTTIESAYQRGGHEVLLREFDETNLRVELHSGRHTIKVSGVGGDEIDPVIFLYSESENDCKIIAADDDDGDGLNPKLDVDITVEGTYILSLSSIDGSGQVKVEVTKAENSTN